MNRDKEIMVKFDTNPPGGSISIDSRLICESTPCEVSLRKDETVKVVATKDLYHDETYILETRLSRWLIGDIALLYPPAILAGILLDAWTQSLWQLERDELLIVLQPRVSKQQEPKREILPIEKPCVTISSTEIQSILQKISMDVIEQQLDWYRPRADDRAKCESKNRVLRNLASMQARAERLDIDEAFRREYFQRTNELADPN